LLGPLADGEMGGEAEDRRRPIHPLAETDRRVVSGTSTLSGGLAARTGSPQTAQLRGLLCDHGQPADGASLSGCRRAGLAQVAQPSLAASGYAVEALCTSAPALPLASHAHCSSARHLVAKL